MTRRAEAENDKPDGAVAAMLRARSIAVIGASGKSGSFGHNVVTHLVDTGYGGRIYPINPRYEEIAGIRCFAEIATLPERVDCAVLAVADERLETALADAAAAHARSAVIFGSAMEEPGRPGMPLTERLAAIAREAGMAMCGGNCMGFLNLVDKVMVGGWPYKPPPTQGPIGFITHSGSSYSGFALNQRQLGMSHMISSGQELATTTAEYLEFLLTQDGVRVIGCILETVRDPERFIAALEAADRKGVPVAVLKLGRSEHGKTMARAHSGALAGSDAAYRAVFERHNVVPVYSLDELADTLELLGCGRQPTTDAVALMTDSGGERTMIVDLAAERGIGWASLAEATTRILADNLDAGLAPINPLDVWGTGHEHERVARTCFQALADDPAVGQVVFASNVPGGRALARTWGRVTEAVHAASAKPVMMLGNLSSAFDRDEAARLRSLGIPVLLGTQSGLHAIAGSIAWHRHRRERRVMATASPPDQIIARWKERLAEAKGASLDTGEGLALAADFGIPIAPSRVIAGESELDGALAALRFPVVLKTLAPAIDHKSDHGGVILGIETAAAARAACQDLLARLGGPMLVQEQVPHGTEIFLGLTVDAQFGPLVTVGLGGVFVEVIKDLVSFVPPIDGTAALTYLHRLKGFPLLEGARGRPSVDLAALSAAVARFSVLATALAPGLAEMDINPIIAGPEGAWAVDALVVPALPSRRPGMEPR
ncbi:MAG: acetate--CoA ligase family protein [Alphaproteobacteria bacterium]|nr:acetate--CoA ligase family protein [Alphaproteobacteria bacterium]